MFHDGSSFFFNFRPLQFWCCCDSYQRNRTSTCDLICARERAQILESLLNSRYCLRIIHVCPLPGLHRKQGWMSCWAVCSTWSNVHHVNFLGWLRLLTPAVMRPMLAIRAQESVLSGPTKRRRCGGQMSWAASLWPAHWCFREAESFILLCVSAECVRAHPWAAWQSMAASRVKALLSRPASSTGDSRLARTGLKSEPYDRCGDRAVAWVDFEGSAICQGQRVSFRAGCQRGQFWHSRCFLPKHAKMLALVERLHLGGNYDFGRQLWPNSRLSPGECR